MRSLLLLCLTLIAAGCGSDAEETMGSGEPAEPWDALMAFQDEPLRMVAYPREMENWAAVKQALTSDQFKSALTTFEQSEVPSAYSDQQAAKDAIVKSFREAVTAAESGSIEDMKAKVDAAMKSLSDLHA